MTSPLAGRKVLVTGGAKRIGAAICRAFASVGAEVTIHFRNSKDEAEKLLAELGGAEKGHKTYSCDLADLSAAKKMIEEVRPFVLVNNASVFKVKNMTEETEEDFFFHARVNFLSPLEMMKTFFAVHKDGEKILPLPSIVNVTDQAVFVCGKKHSAYLASKKLLSSATESAAIEFAPYVRVNAVAPGHTLPPPELAHLKMATTLKTIPLGCAVKPDDVAKAVLFLAETSSVTGETVKVDCGQSLEQKL